MKLLDFFRLKSTPIFTVPGTHILNFLNMINEVEDKVKIFRTEDGAGYGAIAVSALTGRPSTLIVTAGPGITNIGTVLAQAYNDRIPLVVIGVNNWSNTLNERIGTIHELGKTNILFSTITEDSLTIDDPKTFPETINLAYSKAEKLRVPVYIDLPSDIFDYLLANDLDYSFKEPFCVASVNERFVDEIVDAINNSSKMLLYCGPCALSGAVQKLIYDLSEFLDVPIVTTLEIASFISHPNHIGSLLDRIFSNEYGRFHDVFLFSIGCDLGVLETGSGKFQFDKALSLTYKKINRYQYKNAVVECDIEEVLVNVMEKLKRKKYVNTFTRFKDELMSLRREQIDCYKRNYQNYRYFEQIQEAYGEDAVFFVDVFLEGYALTHFWRLDFKQKVVSSQNYVNLGFALPAAVGASLENNNAVCLIGDGGFSYYFSEISTALKYGKKIKVLLFNNSSFGTIDVFAKNNKNLYSLANPDYSKIAQAFRLNYYCCSGNGIKDIIDKAETESNGYIIEICMREKTPMFNRLNWELK